MTPSERITEAKAVLAHHATVRAAATELGTTDDALGKLFARAGSERPAQFLARVTVPEGHRVKGNSTLEGADGEAQQRWVKTEADSAEPPAFAPVPAGHHVQKVSSLLDAQGRVRAQWVQAPHEAVHREELFWAAVEAHVNTYKAIAAPVIQDTQGTQSPWDPEDLLTVIAMGDPHIGMLAWKRETDGEDFDLKIAAKQMLAVADCVVARATPANHAIVANVGDFFHAEDDGQLTPRSGNKLDCDDRWLKITEVGLSIIRRIIDQTLRKFPRVSVVNIPGNHDPRMSRVLALLLRGIYEQEPRVTIVDNANPFVYQKHGLCLLGFTHGLVKRERLPAIMSCDRPVDWGATTFREWITGHVHHETVTEYPGVSVRTLNTTAPRDAWHHENGYRSRQSMCSLTYHRRWGRVHENITPVIEVSGD